MRNAFTSLPAGPMPSAQCLTDDLSPPRNVRSRPTGGSTRQCLAARLAIAALALCGAISSAQAAITTFASFFERIGAPDFVFTNNSPTSGTYSASSPIFFTYLNIPGLPADLQGIQTATITISATTTAPATLVSGSVSQPFPVITTDITITRDVPAAEGNGSRTVLLQVTNTATLSGLNGSTSGNFNAATSTGQTVIFTSEFLDFSSTIARDLAIAMTQITPALGLSGPSGAPGTFLNSFSAVASGNFSSDPVPVATTPLIAKRFSPNPIVPGGISTLTFTLSNNNSMAMTNAAFADTYPAGLVNATPPNVANTCGGALSGGLAGGNTIGLTGVNIPANSSCTIKVDVTAVASGCYANTSGTITSDQGSGNVAADTLCVGLPPTVTKVFSPNPILPGGTSTLTVTITNPNTTSIHGVKFSDSYPAGLFNGNPTNLANSCGGTASAAVNGTSLSLGGVGGTIGAGLSCQVSVTVTAPASGSYVNSTGSITTTDSGNGGPGMGTLVVGFSSVKSFNPNPILPGGASLMTITLNNPTVSAITGVNFIDTYPANLFNTGSPNALTSCGGTATAIGGGNTVALSGGTIPANGSCTVTVNVTSAIAGSYVNSTGPIHSNQGDGAAATGTLVVLGPLTAAKTFLQNPINRGGTSVLQVTLTNPNPAVVTNATFTDSYPANLFNSGTPNPQTTCAAGTATALPNGVSLSLAGGSVPGNGSCTITVNVTSALAGTYVNHTGTISSSAGTTNDVTGTLVVLQEPTVVKSFTPASIALNGTSLLQISITNPNASTITGVAFTDTYPANVFNTGTPTGTATNCGGGALVTALPNDVSVSLGVGSIAPGATCSVSVNVTTAVAGSYLNHTGPVNSSSGTGTDATATLTALSPFTVGKAFNPTTITAAGTSQLSIMLTNPNASAVTGVAFTDSYPANVFNTAVLSAGNTCGGTLAATGGGASVGLSSGTIPANSSCAITINVTTSVGGVYVNSTGTVTSANAGSAGPAQATLTVNNLAPTVSKGFAASPVYVNTPTLMTITLINPNPSPVTGVAFTDTYPSNLTNAAASGAATSCGGSVTALSNGNSVALSGGTIPASSSCTVTVNVQSSIAGSYLNSTGTIVAGNAPSFGPVSATLVVLAVPTVSKGFAPNPILVNGTSQITITLNNSNAQAITGVSFLDTYPAGLVNTASPAAATTCGGTATAASNGNSVALAGGTIPANSSCTVTVNVTSAAGGTYVNNTGNITTSVGTIPGAQGTLIVIVPLSVTKGFNPGTITTGGTSLMTITLTNPNATIAVTGIGFTDAYPSNVVNTGTPGATNTCNGSLTTAPNGNTLQLAGGSILAGGSCAITVNVTSAVQGTYNNSTGTVVTANAGSAGPATGQLIVSNNAVSVVKSFTQSTILTGGTSLLTITLTNPNPAAVTGVAFTDNYPANLFNTASPATTNSCGGSVTAANNGTSVTLTGGTIPASGNCAITLNVTSSVAGSYVNSTGTVTTGNAGNAGPAQATLLVLGPATVNKGFTPSTINAGQTSLLTITLTNPNLTMAITGMTFTDTYPANLQNSATPGATTTCGGTVTAAANGPSVALTGGTLAGGASCTVTVTVTSTTGGTYVNTTGTVTTANAGNGGPATATLTVTNTPFSVAKSFTPPTINSGGTSLLTITLTNTNPGTITGVAFSDTYPSNLLNTATPAGITTCSGTVTAVANGGSLALSGGTIPGNGNCTVTVNVTSNTAGSYVNSTGPVTSTNAGTATPATATLVVNAQPFAVTKSFSGGTITGGTPVPLSITLTNSNPAPVTGASFTDSYPAGLVNTATPNVVNTCGGSAVGLPNGNSLSLTGGTIPANSTCTVTVNVTAFAIGTYVNNTGIVTSGNSGNAGPASATLIIGGPTAPIPTLSPWALVLLVGILLFGGALFIRRTR